MSSLIANTLLVSNTGEYTLEEIRSLAASYSSVTLQAMSRQGKVWVYEESQRVQGVVCLERGSIQALFVTPDHQSRGIGRALLGMAEEAAVRSGASALEVPASLTAVGFYESVGFQTVGPGRSSGGVLIERMRKQL